jgi:hypothetical protein
VRPPARVAGRSASRPERTEATTTRESVTVATRVLSPSVTAATIGSPW